MELGLEGKKVAITASTDGIGLATARKFLDEGASVLINGRKQDKAEYTYNLLRNKFGQDRVYCFVGDMTVEENILDMKKYAQSVLKKVDCLVANVGSGKPISDNKLDINEWRGSFDTNLFSTVMLIDAFNDMLAQNGSVLMISSLAGCSRIGAPYAYAASKDGIRVLTKYMSDDFAKRNIRVNCVVPGNVFYKGGRWDELISNDEKGTKQYIEENVPLKRFATPEEIANSVVFLASECASFITGTSLVVDGGQIRGID
jgi:3-oxoacyl-[acyl-carrier protein] reductase